MMLLFAFHSHRGFSPVMGRVSTLSSRFNGFTSKAQETVETVPYHPRLLITGLKPRCE
jgi:hypothetical protein